MYGRRGCQTFGDDWEFFRLEADRFDFFLAPFFGSVVGIYVLIFKKSHLIPYGPFLSLAAITALFFGDRIISLVIFHY